MPGSVPRHDPHGDRAGLVRGRLRPYAEVLRDDHPQMQVYRAGKSGRAPGRLLREYLQDSDGRYEFRMPIAERLKVKIRELADLHNDAQLRAVAEEDLYPISLEHLRAYDPDTTLIVCGLHLQYTEEDANTLRRGGQSSEPPTDRRVYLAPPE